MINRNNENHKLIIRVTETYIEHQYAEAPNWRKRTWDYEMKDAIEAEKKFAALKGYDFDPGAFAFASIDFVFINKIGG